MRKNLKDADNKLLSSLFDEDQKEREHFFDNPEKVTANDTARRRKVSILLRNGKVKTWEDYFNASFIFLHGLGQTDYIKACRLAKKSIELGGEKWSRWLYAVATDRLLVTQGKKQKYGTQFSVISKKDPQTGKVKEIAKMLPYDKRTTDKTREWHCVAPIKVLLSRNGKASSKAQNKILLDDK